MKDKGPLKAYWLIAAVWVSPHAFALQDGGGLPQMECEARDFSGQLGPLRSQGTTNWSWAIATADLLTFQRGRTSAQKPKPGWLARLFAPEARTPSDPAEAPHANAPAEPISAAGLVASCASFDPEVQSQRLGRSYLQARAAAKTLEAQKSEPAAKVRSSVLAALYCAQQSGNVCLESEAPLSAFSRGKYLFGSSGFREQAELACKTKLSLPEFQISLERFGQRLRPNPAATLARWLREGSPVAIESMGRESTGEAAVVAGMRWSTKSRSCEFLLRDSRRALQWLSADVLNQRVELALKISAPLASP